MKDDSFIKQHGIIDLLKQFLKFAIIILFASIIIVLIFV
jgi:hypothetical protein